MSTVLPALSRATSSTRYIRWTTVVLCLVAAVLIFGGFSFYSRATTRGTDFNVFYLGGRLIVERPGELYEQNAPRGRSYTFVSPPLVAVLMAPLSALPLEAAVMVWLTVNVTCTLHAAWLLSRLLAPAGLTLVFFAVMLVATLAYSVENIILGQVHAVLLYLMVLAFAGLRQGRPLIAGISLGVATAIKLLPGILAVYLVVRRRWWAVAAFLLALTIATVVVPLIALGPGGAMPLLGDFYELQVAPYLSLEASQQGVYLRTALRKTQHDHDLGALLMRHLTAEHALPGYEALVIARLELGVVRKVMFGLFGVILVISAVAVWPGRRSARWPSDIADLGFSMFVVLSGLLSPRSRVAYWPVLMIPSAVLLNRVLDTRLSSRYRQLAGWTIGVSAALGTLAVVPILPGLTPGFWAQCVLWCGLVLFCFRERTAASVPS